MDKRLEDQGLPANILSILEGYPAQVPSFPTIDYVKEDERLIPGGPSSSKLLIKTNEDIRVDLNSLLLELVKDRQKKSAAFNLLQGLTPVQNSINDALSLINGLSSNNIGGVVDFYDPGLALLNSSVCSVESIYGQVTLPYTNNPQSQILRNNNYGPRPGTILRYSKIPQGSSLSPDTYVYDDSDPETFFAIDGSFDTSWQVPIENNQDLIVSLTLPPTLGNNAQVNSIGITPWPLFGATIIEAYIRDGGSASSTLTGWTKLSLAGQINYNANSQTIPNSRSHRLFFSPSSVQEILIRLRPQSTNRLGIINLDCWAIEFASSGKLDINASQVGVSNISGVVLSGLNPSSLSRLPVVRTGSQITINLSSVNFYESPVITTVGIKPVAVGQQDTGFDVSVFS